MNQTLRPAVEQTVGIPGARSSENPRLVRAVADTNARLAAAMLLERSAVLRELVQAGSLRIASAMHDVSTGEVTFLR